MKTTKWRFTSKYLGLRPYDEVLSLQMQAWQERSSDPAKEALFFGCEHPDTITLGRRAGPEEVLNLNSSIPVHQIDRGGQATLHSPGQLVIYPILNLRYSELGVRDFVRFLLKTTQKLLIEYGIETECQGDAGLYTQAGKICFVGLRVENGVTRHGLSLNVSNDLGLFRNIVPCGVSSQQMDSMQNHGVDIVCDQLFDKWVQLAQK